MKIKMENLIKSLEILHFCLDLTLYLYFSIYFPRGRKCLHFGLPQDVIFKPILTIVKWMELCSEKEIFWYFAVVKSRKGVEVVRWDRHTQPKTKHYIQIWTIKKIKIVLSELIIFKTKKVIILIFLVIWAKNCLSLLFGHLLWLF